MPASLNKNTEALTPTFVFKGTVKKLKSATMKDVPVDDRTAVVTVDQIIEAPADLADYNGQDITVQLGGRQKIKTGQELIFHTVSWMYGDSVAVRSLSQEPLKDSHAAMLTSGVDPAERRAQREQQEHFQTADLVVSGKVVAVRLPDEAAQTVKGAGVVASEQPPSRPISEHDPKWREAVVQIDDVHKGVHKQKQVVVRFPASTDVMWYGAPKFHPGQQGFFLLHKTEAGKPKTMRVKKRSGKRAATETVAAGPEVGATETYTALDQMDFQPYHEPGGIKAIIESETMKKQ